MLFVNSTISAIALLQSLGACITTGRKTDAPTVGLLNLMPQKQAAEYDFCRVLAAAATDLNLVLLKIPGQTYKTTPQSYIDAHYRDFIDDASTTLYSHSRSTHNKSLTTVAPISIEQLDGLIVTGAPLEQMPYEAVRYWPQLQRIWEKSAALRLPTLNICWAAQAALYHFYGIHKVALPQKCFGIFSQRSLSPQHPLLLQLGKHFPMPHSRHTSLDLSTLPPSLEALTDSEVGKSLFHDASKQQTFVTGHWEYAADTLHNEYLRDLDRCLPIQPPRHYYIDNNPTAGIDYSWRDTAEIFFRNWTKTLQSLHRS